VNLTHKELEVLESPLKDASSEKASTAVESLKVIYGEMERSNSQFTDEIFLLEKELQEEKDKSSQQQQLRADLSKTEQSLKEIKSLTAQEGKARSPNTSNQRNTSEVFSHRGFEGKLPTAGKPQTTSTRNKSTEHTGT
jgi:hypothetical protein